MDTNENVKKNTYGKIVIVLFTIIAIVLLAGFAYARYITKLNGNAQVPIASWNFNVTVGSKQNLNIDLAETREANDNNEVSGSKVAPGTKGALVLNINATGSQVSLAYDIDLSLTQVPENLIFYSDAARTNAIYKENGLIHFDGYFSQGTANKTDSKTLYWEWPMETGSTQNEINHNDELDSNWIGDQIVLGIEARGRQVTEEIGTKYAVTFDANGGTLQEYGNASQATKMVTYGETYGSLPTPSREGYEFKGWNGKNFVIICYPYNNNMATVENGVVTQKYADSRTDLQWKLQTMNNNKITSTLEIKNKNTVGRISFSFVKNENFNAISFGLNGEQNDTKVYCYVDKLNNNTTYTLSFNILNVTQGNVSWNNIQIEEGSTATAYEPYYITSSTEVVQNQNHTLTAIWEPTSNSNP